MQLREALEIIDGKMISTDVDLTRQVDLGGGADLMSDLLAFGQEGMLLMTGLTNPQIVRTAELAGVAAIVFVRGKIPPPETISLASQKGIPLLASKYTMFETCGRLYKAGLAASTLFETVLKQWYEAFDTTKKRDSGRP
jgi:predicted transcriptional regulator